MLSCALGMHCVAELRPNFVGTHGQRVHWKLNTFLLEQAGCVAYPKGMEKPKAAEDSSSDCRDEQNGSQGDLGVREPLHFRKMTGPNQTMCVLIRADD